ncbi:uncharacterized protein BKCO1_1500028 [Diplodia corticola]|uniref:Uncharacterized protein n=1 Tax=Diplodia corticola TaxID=236234 RepID=A0A1J9R546_9PEZI|nr:uncharacterized protein BKCO1_1500028 [Diplodia corticola]OJD35720.1 hypothetical protein BKCO1_1500028 [Diplodia corticola]
MGVREHSTGVSAWLPANKGPRRTAQVNKASRSWRERELELELEQLELLTAKAAAAWQPAMPGEDEPSPIGLSLAALALAVMPSSPGRVAACETAGLELRALGLPAAAERGGPVLGTPAISLLQ